jgi:hypothetical protein
MTEVEVRTALRDFDGVGSVEHWIADQPRQAAAGGWAALTDLDS